MSAENLPEEIDLLGSLSQDIHALVDIGPMVRFTVELRFISLSFDIYILYPSVIVPESVCVI